MIWGHIVRPALAYLLGRWRQTDRKSQWEAPGRPQPTQGTNVAVPVADLEDAFTAIGRRDDDWYQRLQTGRRKALEDSARIGNSADYEPWADVSYYDLAELEAVAAHLAVPLSERIRFVAGPFTPDAGATGSETLAVWLDRHSPGSNVVSFAHGAADYPFGDARIRSGEVPFTFELWAPNGRLLGRCLQHTRWDESSWKPLVT